MDSLPQELIMIISSMIPTDDLVTAFRAVNKNYFAISQSVVKEIGPSFKRDQTNNDHQIMVLARDYPSITSLDLLTWDLSKVGLAVVLTKFPGLKSLKLPPLYLTQGQEIFKHVVPSVTSLVLNCPSAYNNIFTSSVDMTDLRKTFPNLEHLEVLDTPVASMLEDMLRGMKTLKSLTIHRSAEEIANQPVLKTLTLIGNHQTSVNIADCPMLETLNFLKCDLQGFDFLKHVPNLQHLTLQRGFQDLWGRTDLTYDATQMIDNIIRYNTNIKTLRLYWYRVTSKSLERLVNELPNLKKIVLSSNKYDQSLPETAAILQAKRTDLQITVTRPKHTVGIDLDVYNDLLNVKKTSDPFVECQYCHCQYQCDPQMHEEVCLEWPTWSCWFMNDGCTKHGMTKEEMRVHFEQCDYNLIKCPMNGCNEFIRRRELGVHNKKHKKTLEFRLKEARMICPNLQRGCTALFDTQADMLNHMSKCQHSHPVCMSCQESFPSLDECAKHMSECRVTPKKKLVTDETLALIMDIAAKRIKNNTGRDLDSFQKRTPVYFRSSYGSY